MTNKLISAQEWCDIRKLEFEKTRGKAPCSSKAFYEKIQYNALTHLIFMLPTDNESYQRSKDYAQEMASSKQFTHEYNSAFCGFRNGQKELMKTLNDAYMQQMELLDMKYLSKMNELSLAKKVVEILHIKANKNCKNKKWRGQFENGNGDDFGKDIDDLIKMAKQIIKQSLYNNSTR